MLWQDPLYEQAGIIDDEGFEVLDRKGGRPGIRCLRDLWLAALSVARFAPATRLAATLMRRMRRRGPLSRVQ